MTVWVVLDEDEDLPMRVLHSVWSSEEKAYAEVMDKMPRPNFRQLRVVPMEVDHMEADRRQELDP